jgi:hypothetical protein
MINDNEDNTRTTAVPGTGIRFSDGPDADAEAAHGNARADGDEHAGAAYCGAYRNLDA